MSAKDKLCLVTGGSRGIGKEIVQTLSRSGYSIAFTYNKNTQLARDLENELVARGCNVKSFQMTIDKRKNVVTTLDCIHGYFNDTISILVNNAAIAQEKTFETISDSDWETMLKVNLQGPFICSQLLLPDMIKNKWGRLINITSIGGQWGGFNQVHYAASKAALINFTQSTAKIFSKDGITSNAVAVGLAKTDMSGPELVTIEVKNK